MSKCSRKILETMAWWPVGFGFAASRAALRRLLIVSRQYFARENESAVSNRKCFFATMPDTAGRVDPDKWEIYDNAPISRTLSLGLATPRGADNSNPKAIRKARSDKEASTSAKVVDAG